MTALPLPRAAAGPSRLRTEFRAAAMVWRREMIHFLRDRTRAVIGLLQPLLFLFVLGFGLSRIVSGNGDYLVFLFPGVLVMAVQAPAISAGGSLVTDRQTGFLREMLVSPVRRTSLLLGKCFGGASVAACQGLIVLACAGLIGVRYRITLLLALFAELCVVALAMTVLGATVAVLIRRMQTFTTVLTVLMSPLLFLSGVMFPISALPGWINWLSLVNPLTYGVDAMRQQLGAGSGALFTPVTWGGWALPPLLELALVLGFTVLCLGIAARRFGRADQ